MATSDLIEPHITDAARDRDYALVARMLTLFELEKVDRDHFRIPGLQTKPRRIFGGQFVAQALSAAIQTVDSARLVHSLHAYFMRSGLTTLPLDFAVSRDRDGSNYSTRRVLISQNDDPIISMAASFQEREAGDHHQISMPSVPAPESLEDDYTLPERIKDMSPGAQALLRRGSPFQFRSTEPEERFALGKRAPRQEYWFRTAAKLPQVDAAMHCVLLTYASDMMLLGTGMIPHGLRWFEGGGSVRIASLDHSLWLHGDVQVDEWMFYMQESPWSGEGRNLNRGHIFDRSGGLIATVSQEGMMRRNKAPSNG